jgi:cyanophycin synthetase
MENTLTHPKDYCPDCGPVGVSHAMERWSARLDPIITAIGMPLEAIWIVIRPAIDALQLDRLLPLLYSFLAVLHLGTINETPDEKNLLRAKVIWDEAKRRGIVMKEFRLFGMPRELFWASFQGKVLAFDGLPRPHNSSQKSLAWMDDKGVILKKFRAAGIPVPRGSSCRSYKQAKQIFETIGGSVIVKPNLGSRSRHTYVNITTLDALRHAFLKAKELTPYPVIEEELRGFVFRITLVGGAIAGIMRREPPNIIGDGIHTVRELVAEENKNPLRHGPIFHELNLNAEAEQILAEQHLSFDAIVPKNHMAILHPKVSRAYGASTTEFETSAMHPDNAELFLKIGTVLNAPFVGVDFMIEDITRSWREQKKCGVIECNSLPFIDLHSDPLVGKPKNIAAQIWDICYPKSKAAH